MKTTFFLQIMEFHSDDLPSQNNENEDLVYQHPAYIQMDVRKSVFISQSKLSFQIGSFYAGDFRFFISQKWLPRFD